ncbi:MAG TPA: endonuclease/exonuclease/phosphatase family protein, partial [Verrucomicrobiae bacterium]|nr:endonuclease/exonuclease/phosphatase family protein [Verrucomicrobiae bacterium]
MILATAIPLVRKDDWWVRIFDFPRLQIAVITAAVIVAYVLFLNPFGITEYAFIAALLLCLLYQAFMIYPYTPLARKQVQQSMHAKKESTLSLLFSNVLMDNRNAARLKQIIREFDPDIVVTAETDSWWQEQLKELERTYS